MLCVSVQPASKVAFIPCFSLLSADRTIVNITEFPCNGDQDTASNERLRCLLAYSNQTKYGPMHFPKEPYLKKIFERVIRLTLSTFH